MLSSFNTAPSELRSLVVQTYDELTSLGMYTPEEVERMTMRLIQHAGWFQTSQGWSRLGPDVREKVNIRKAEPQPDGLFLIRDVDVFYPNSVKGKTDDRMFTKDDIARAIVNTNTAIQAGGQKPSLALEHPHLIRHLTGSQAKSFGSGINWRWSPRGNGWVRCDLIDVAPAVVVDWKNHQWTGLSAGFANDADDLNLRFGHIALLGVESQALSFLPITEVFSVENQLCFSTESRYFQQKEPQMADRRQAFSALKNAYSAMSSAYAAAESGEPNYESKVSQAKSQFDAATKQFGAMGDLGTVAGGAVGGPVGALAGGALGGALDGGDQGGGGGGGQIPDLSGELGGGEPAATAPAMCASGTPGATPQNPPFNASQEPQEQTWLPEGTQIPLEGGHVNQNTDTPQGSANSHFSAQDFGAMKNTIKELQTVIGALKESNVMTQFSAFSAKAKADGHQFDEKLITNLFTTGFRSGSKAVMDSAVALIKGSPKVPSLANMGQTFAAHESDNPSREAGASLEAIAEGEVEELIRKHAPGIHFSASDFKLGEAFSGL